MEFLASNGRRFAITPQAVAAFKAGRYRDLHQALGLVPWEASPLPVEATLLGIDRDEPPLWLQLEGIADWRQAVELQRCLIEAIERDTASPGTCPGNSPPAVPGAGSHQ